mgnify:CR=1 FL=1
MTDGEVVSLTDSELVIEMKVCITSVNEKRTPKYYMYNKSTDDQHMNTFNIMENYYDLPCNIGNDQNGIPITFDLSKIPHLLIGGAPGCGKSMVVNSIVTSLLENKTADEMKFVLIDPRKVEYEYLRTLSDSYLVASPQSGDVVISDVNDAVNVVSSLCELMQERYDSLRLSVMPNVKEYNSAVMNGELSKEYQYMSYIVVLINDIDCLMLTAGREFEMPLCKLAQLSRATGIHLVLSSNRPSFNVFTPFIKANVPGRIALKTLNADESRSIMDLTGAECLDDKGELICKLSNIIVKGRAHSFRYQDIQSLCERLNCATGNYSAFKLPVVKVIHHREDIERDPCFAQIARFVFENQVASISMIPRKFCLGYYRVCRVLDQLEDSGIISSARTVLVKDLSQIENIV